LEKMLIRGLVFLVILCVFGIMVINSNAPIAKAHSTSLNVADSEGTPNSADPLWLEPEDGDPGGPPGPGRG
jgi:uncharacterized protein YpmB